MADAGLVQTSLVWAAYAVAVGCCVVAALVTTLTWQTPRERSAVVSVVAVVALASLLATVLLLPVDAALVSATASPALGAKKAWASPARVARMLATLRAVYYALYGVDALLCLVVVPFAYFWYEEYDEVKAEELGRSWRSRFWAAARHALFFVALVAVVVLVGFVVPAAGDAERAHWDLDYFRRLLARGRADKALTFALGLFVTLGTLLYVVYTAAGMALMPVALVRSAPAISAPQLSATTASQLELNRERQRQLEMRNAARPDAMSRKDRRELDALVREEQTLVRRERLAAQALGDGRGRVYRAWLAACALFRPIKMLGGLLLLAVSLLVWVSMSITAVDKANNSLCKQRCGYILAHMHLFQPFNWIFVQTARVFPVDYVLMALLLLFLFSSTISGIANLGIRFLWIRIFQIRRGRTAPQALLIATVMMALAILAINYAVAMLIAPQYATYGTQTFCTRKPDLPGAQPDCSRDPDLVRPCSEALKHSHAHDVCTPSVMSTFLNRVSITWPFFGIIDFWAQFVFLGVVLVVFVAAVVRTPRVSVAEMDEDAEADEEESLLALAGRRFGATSQDVRGKPAARNSSGRNEGGSWAA